MSYHRWPATKSGDATVIPLTDDQAVALLPGDCVMVEVFGGLAPFAVTLVRSGVVESDTIGADSYSVPVVEGSVVGANLPLVYAVPDLYWPDVTPEAP